MNELSYDVWELIVNKNCETIEQKLDKVDDIDKLLQIHTDSKVKINKILYKMEDKYEIGRIIQVEGNTTNNNKPIYSVIKKKRFRLLYGECFSVM